MKFLASVLTIFLALQAFPRDIQAGTNVVWLDEIDLSLFFTKDEHPRGPSRRRVPPFVKVSESEAPLSIGGETFQRGIAVHAPCILLFDLDGKAKRFSAKVGMSLKFPHVAGGPQRPTHPRPRPEGAEGPPPPKPNAEFLIYTDGRCVADSGNTSLEDNSKEIEVDLRGKRQLALVASSDSGASRPRGPRFDYAVWADARFEFDGKSPVPVRLKKKAPYILTPKPPKTPRINGPKVFGVRPGSALLYTIPATGDRPMKFAAQNLPKSLTVNSDTGNIKGILSKAGTYRVTFAAQNKWGKTEREFRIVVGDAIALTPPMGWNSWNCWAGAVDAKKIKAAAQAMKDTGLINHGWTYINIDDTWQGKRGGPFNAIQGNEKFTDMKGLCDYVHSLGLKIGIYSTPWVVSYAGYLGGSSNNKNGDWEFGEYPMHRGPGGPGARRMPGREHGKYSFAKNDAKQWAEWGIDYLKYDWRPNDVEHVEDMSLALKETGRDTVYSLSNSADFEQAGEWARLSNCWRTTGDIRDSWESVSGIGFSQSQWAPYAGPGHWNDPDMLVVGQVGWGPNLHPSRLNPEEQYTHISLWCLLSAPLLLGCDLNQLDEFTLNVLANDEVLQVDQDPLGKQATCIAKKHRKQIWAKDMEDGSKAVGLFNLDFPFLQPANMTVNWQTLGIQGKYRVRDLWRQKNLGVFEGSFTAEVPAHGVVLVRVFPKETENK